MKLCLSVTLLLLTLTCQLQAATHKVRAAAKTKQVTWTIQYAVCDEVKQTCKIVFTTPGQKPFPEEGPIGDFAALQQHFHHIATLAGTKIKAKNTDELTQTVARISLAYGPEAEYLLDALATALTQGRPLVLLEGYPSLDEKYFPRSGGLSSVFLARLMGKVAAKSGHKVYLSPKPTPKGSAPSQRAILKIGNTRREIVIAPGLTPITYK